MHLEFLVEEPSAEAALQGLLPKIVDPAVSFAIHAYQGKPDLLGKLPGALRGYHAWLPKDAAIVVLLDNDRDDCQKLEARLELMAAGAGFLTRSTAPAASAFRVVNRLAVEELKAWFFGDMEAMRAAYPKLPETLGNQSRYRRPDAIAGGTWEALERVLRRAGYYRTGAPKIQVARDISAHMRPEINRSRSFDVFLRGLQELISQTQSAEQ
ncbi:MAG: DUF4276 family protein [Chloroflexi bacterium]|nr:DUF4276 family protein [Chloroflexota bacterium]